MKKLIIALLALSLLLSSCKSGNENDSESLKDTESSESINIEDANETKDTTLGDTDGNGIIDDTTDNGQKDPVKEIKSSQDAINFIDVNVYGQCSDVLPMMVETRELSKNDMDSVTFNTGLTDISGVEYIILSESMVGSFAYSFVYVHTDGTNTDDIASAMAKNINPAKWICVSAEAVRSVILDNDIILVMGNLDQVDTIMSEVLKDADGVYTSIGSVSEILG